MKLFRYTMIWADGVTDFGLAYGTDERDVAEYITYGITAHLSRIEVHQDDDLCWPAAIECPMGG